MAIKLKEPAGVEAEYVKTLKRFARRLQKASNEILIPEIPRLVEKARGNRADGYRADESPWIVDLQNLLDDVLGVVTSVNDIGLASVIGKLRDMPGPNSIEDIDVEAFAEQIDRHGLRQVKRAIKKQYDELYGRAEPWRDDALAAWEAENLRLIKSIPENYVSDLQGTVTRAINEGESATDLAAIIKGTYDKPKKRAELIAKDQVGKLHSQLAKERLESIGVKEYKWRGILDSRERPEHIAREGKVFKWSQPPPDGHPGQPIHCRCYPEPIWPKRDKARLS